jgi:hypothetical protein
MQCNESSRMAPENHPVGSGKNRWRSSRFVTSFPRIKDCFQTGHSVARPVLAGIRYLRAKVPFSAILRLEIQPLSHTGHKKRRPSWFLCHKTSFQQSTEISQGSIYFPTNALRNTKHTTHTKNPTCFGTQVPSSGSYCNKGAVTCRLWATQNITGVLAGDC